jgi:hypothetical protein
MTLLIKVNDIHICNVKFIEVISIVIISEVFISIALVSMIPKLFISKVYTPQLILPYKVFHSFLLNTVAFCPQPYFTVDTS